MGLHNSQIFGEVSSMDPGLLSAYNGITNVILGNYGSLERHWVILIIADS